LNVRGGIRMVSFRSDGVVRGYFGFFTVATLSRLFEVEEEIFGFLIVTPLDVSIDGERCRFIEVFSSVPNGRLNLIINGIGVGALT